MIKPSSNLPCSSGMCHRLAMFAILLLGTAASAQDFDLVILNGRVIDPGSGLDSVRNVGVKAGRIKEITARRISGRQNIDAKGKVVAPGFIDLNIQAPDLKTNRYRILDGVTSAFVTESGPLDLEEWYERASSWKLINLGAAVGFWEARLEVVGDKSLEGEKRWAQAEHTKASEEQIARTLELMENELQNGAIGIGVPLEYIPAATQAEIVEVFRLAARYDAPVFIHIRSWGYDEKKIRSYGDLYEVIGAALLTGARVHVLHLNSSYGVWTPVGLELLSKARERGLDISADSYPYEYGACPSGAAYFDDWESYPEEYFRTKLRLASTKEWLTKEKFREIRNADNEVPLLCYDNTEEMVELAVAAETTIVASDGGSAPHPRLAGTYSRVLGLYVREKNSLSLNTALAKMTILPARVLEDRVPAMKKKGRISVGSDADIIVFDPATIVDRATVLEPYIGSFGISSVVLNGVPVVSNGQFTDAAQAGKLIRAERKESRQP